MFGKGWGLSTYGLSGDYVGMLSDNWRDFEGFNSDTVGNWASRMVDYRYGSGGMLLPKMYWG